MDYVFGKIFKDGRFDLPQICEEKNFEGKLKDLYDSYIELLMENKFSEVGEIDNSCKDIIEALEYYHNGFPHKAFEKIKDIMEKLIEKPLNIYAKTLWYEDFLREEDLLKLYRMRSVDEVKEYEIEDIFHIPYNLRAKISSNRYSISGYPSLYLSTSLELCKQELKKNEKIIVSQFSIKKKQKSFNVKVLELALKPKDFFKTNKSGRVFHDLNISAVKEKYFFWYPIILACSFERKNKNDPFSSEYIVPQLIMQWLRVYYETKKTLMGIRYFSCASKEASELGFNYVFPASGKKAKNKEFCEILAKSFKFTKPELFEYNDEITIENRKFIQMR